MKKKVVLFVSVCIIVLLCLSQNNYVQNFYWHVKGHPVRVTYNGEKMKLSGQYFIAEKQGVTFYVIPSSFAERMKDNCRFCKKSNTDTDTTVILNEDYGILVD